jgi:hypothetical protein
MALPNLKPQKHTMQDLQEEQDHTLSWVQVHPVGIPHLIKVTDFQNRIDQHLIQERKLKQTIAAQLVLIYLIDQELNTFVQKLLALLPEQGERPPELLRSHYLGQQAPSDFMRPILGEQLEKMRSWVSSLLASSNSAMHQLGKELDLKIKDADTAIKVLRDAENALSDFLHIGDRHSIFIEANELRKRVYEAVEVARLGLGDAFFLHDISQRQLSLEGSIKSSQTRFDRLSAALEEEKARLDELKAKKSERETQEAERQAAVQKLSELQAQTKQLKSEIKTTPKKKKR